jgi:DNA-binding transcriptional ArsR family regulator
MKKPKKKKGGGGVRYTDPSTSHDAAASIDVTKNENTVYRAVLSQGRHGATWDELVELTTMPRQSISPRLKPLREKGLLIVPVDSNGDEIKRLGACGRDQLVHIAVKATLIKSTALV